jgi:hypothetical protein
MTSLYSTLRLYRLHVPYLTPQFETLWTRNATAAARVAVSLDKAGATLRVILNHPRAVDLFHRHVTAEYSPENYEFWKLVTDFQNSTETKSDAALVRIDLFHALLDLT